MAEILLEPSNRSKIIPLSFDLNDTSASNAAQLMTKRQFNTADTDAWFQISLDDFVDTSGSFDITLFNLNDKSVFNHTGKPFTTSPFYYKLDSESDETTNEIRHAGRWIGQIVVTLANGNSATRKFIFDIEGHILDGADVQTILLEDYNALIATINTSKDLLAQYNVDYAALLVDLAAAETARTATYNQLVADQQANIDAFDVALDTGIVAANLATKLQDFETTNNSRLLSAEQQLADKVNYKKVYLKEMGLIGDGTFRSIATLFPDVLLSEVQALDAAATLSDSADWYILQKLTNTVEDNTEIIIDGKYIIDLPIVVNRNSVYYKGKTVRLKGLGLPWSIGNIGINTSAFIFGSLPYASQQQNIGIEDIAITGSKNVNGTKSKHGIELAKTVAAQTVQEVCNLTLKNCLVSGHGGCGMFADDMNLIVSKFINCEFSYNVDDGVKLFHTGVRQYNCLSFDRTSAMANGYDYTNGEWVRSSPSKLRGHGFNVSGTAISIEGGDTTGNASAGVYLNDGSSNGVGIHSNYSEACGLADIYVGIGPKENIDIGADNYCGSDSSLHGKVYFEMSDTAINKVDRLDVPFINYIHSANKEVIVSAVDTSTGTFTSIGHGLVNGDKLYPIINADAGAVYPYDKYPSGLTSKGWPGYYVINVDADTFQLSSTSEGGSITLTENVNMDLTKWHFEKPISNGYFTLSLPNISKFKCVVSGQVLQSNSQALITGEAQSPNFLMPGSSVFVPASLGISGDIYNYGEIVIDYTDKLTIDVHALVSWSSNKTQNVVNEINKRFVSVKNSDGNKAVNSLLIDSLTVANGFNIKIYPI